MRCQSWLVGCMPVRLTRCLPKVNARRAGQRRRKESRADGLLMDVVKILKFQACCLHSADDKCPRNRGSKKWLEAPSKTCQGES